MKSFLEYIDESRGSSNINKDIILSYVIEKYGKKFDIDDARSYIVEFNPKIPAIYVIDTGNKSWYPNTVIDTNKVKSQFEKEFPDKLQTLYDQKLSWTRNENILLGYYFQYKNIGTATRLKFFINQFKYNRSVKVFTEFPEDLGVLKLKEVKKSNACSTEVVTYRGPKDSFDFSSLSTTGMNIIFIKKDGSRRSMRCTQNLAIIPQEKHPKGIGTGSTADLKKVFDLDIQEWRSFKVDTVIDAEPLKDDNSLKDIDFSALHTTGMQVTFIKKDGTKRVMLCTTNVSALPDQYQPLGDDSVQPNINVKRVFDLEKKGWRSFNIDSVIDTKPLERFKFNKLIKSL